MSGLPGQAPDGKLVPCAAHIRKVNPRSAQLPDGDSSKFHRLLRRGTPYGDAAPHDAPAYQGEVTPKDDRGLLFICYQASIEDGFEFVQTRWSNAPDFPVSGAGLDPVISQGDGVNPRPFLLPTPSGTGSESFAAWVQTTGGGYFFSPGLAGLESLVIT